MNELALFAGTGGGILGTRLLGWRVVCAVEINPYCREVLLRRQEEGILKPFPIWDDVRTFDGTAWRGTVDVITGGFPCQGYSVAGKRQGEYDERNLWPDTIRIIRDVRPRYCVLENVPNLLTFEYFGTILRDLAEGGFTARYKIISAAEVGAPHLRNRLWIVADSNKCGGAQSGLQQSDIFAESSQEVADTKGTGWPTWASKGQFGRCCEMADTTGGRFKQCLPWGESEGDISQSNRWWATEPRLGRVVDGMAYRVDRLKALGNGQVPGVVRAAWELLGNHPL